jgi:hypothetical protein
MDFPVDGLAECHLGVIVDRPFKFEGDMDVHLHLHVPEGCKLIETTTHETQGKTFMVARVVPTLLLCLLWAGSAWAQVMRVESSGPPLSPADAVAVWTHAVPPTVIPVFYDGPTVTFTGATVPSLGPWDMAGMGPLFNRSQHGYPVTARRAYPGYAWGSALALRAWEPQAWSGGVHLQSFTGSAGSAAVGHGVWRDERDGALTLRRGGHLPWVLGGMPGDLLRQQASDREWLGRCDVGAQRRR